MRNKQETEYWEKRKTKYIRDKIRNSDKEAAKLKRYYKSTLKTLKNDLREACDTLEGKSKAIQLKRLESFYRQIEEDLKDLEAKQTGLFQTTLFDAYKDTIKVADEDIGISFTMLPKEQIEKAVFTKWSGMDFSERIWLRNTKLAKNVREVMTLGLVRGESYHQMAQRFAQLMDSDYKSAKRLIRNETAHIVNQANLDRYAQHKVEKVEILVAEDERMCKLCGSHYGKIVPIRDADSYIQVHVNCRCTIAPVIDDTPVNY